ncbi:DNA primase [Barnesiella viscericola]|uniref:DNA primase n=1 Tax=Barnesiella viscericola TaxID=397865 RepID=UPI0025A377F2|nr:DNA primase [Barnesiella viscericola]MDM8268091.1 DNA primase [Barnesiella viscericola]
MIDQATIDKIMAATDIVDVVSDFVSLRRRGANYWGLCPFHDDRSPSFSVSPSKGVCKCFSCGKGGSAIHFIMEHEQLSYYEALKYLAKKYNIEVHEKELTDEERQKRSERENMFVINTFAQEFFSKSLLETDEGRSVGLAYFKERGFNEDIIRKFGLGYSPEKRDALAVEAQKRGYKIDYLLKTGLCREGQNGRIYDLFSGRVMFPVYSVSGKVVAFGGRILKSGVKISKYFNSPESDIYHKSDELYGIYQAKRAIEKERRCYLVEGYTDVLSMHQSGIENVVASSGTALTHGQIRLIHRFTDNITVLYDGDAPGIKASLRGIDLLLQEGLNIKVVLLPDGEDPDSFAKSQSAESFTRYIKEHETDFIRFKTQLLLEDAGEDPIKRADIISNIVESISLIPDAIVRSVYVQECSRLLQIDEQVLLSELNKRRQKRAEQQFSRERYNQERQSAATTNAPKSGNTTTAAPANGNETPPPPSLADMPAPAETPEAVPVTDHTLSQRMIQQSPLEKYEREIIRYIVRYGYRNLFELPDGSWQKVWEYIVEELSIDNIELCNPLYKHIVELTAEQREYEAQQVAALRTELQVKEQKLVDEAIEQIRLESGDIADKQRKEAEAQTRIAREMEEELQTFETNFLERYFTTHPDSSISMLAVDLVSEKYQLSKVHTKFQKVELEADRLWELIPRAIYELKNAILEQSIKQIQEQIKEASRNKDEQRIIELIEQNVELNRVRTALAKQIGDRIVSPR